METVLESKIDAIHKAIDDKEIISFLYVDAGKKILAEPYQLGFHPETNKSVLLAFECSFLQVFEDNKNWKLYELDRMSELQITGMKIKLGRNVSDEIAKTISEFIYPV